MSEHPTRRLSDYLDGELSPAEAARLERHLAECDECTAVLADLRAVADRARSLEDRTAPAELWAEIAARIGDPPAEGPVAGSIGGGRPDGSRRAEGPHATGGATEPAGGAADPLAPGAPPRRRTRRRIALSLPQLAAAAAALLLLGGGGVWLWTDGGGPGAGATATTGRPAGGAFPGEGAALLAGSSAEGDGVSTPTAARYRAAIAELERATFEGGGGLDTATVRKLRESLEKIDRAIEEAREALREDPGSPYLNQHLAETMRQKVRFLRHTATLVAAQS